MGLSLRAAKNRQRLWLEAGGASRERIELIRYDLKTGRKRNPTT
jgi:hypothetical protein